MKLINAPLHSLYIYFLRLNGLLACFILHPFGLLMNELFLQMISEINTYYST